MGIGSEVEHRESFCYNYSNHSTAFLKGEDGIKMALVRGREYASVCFTAFDDVLMHMVVQR